MSIGRNQKQITKIIKPPKGGFFYGDMVKRTGNWTGIATILMRSNYWLVLDSAIIEMNKAIIESPNVIQ